MAPQKQFQITLYGRHNLYWLIYLLNTTGGYNTGKTKCLRRRHIVLLRMIKFFNCVFVNPGSMMDHWCSE
jgi:hypothetical protein